MRNLSTPVFSLKNEIFLHGLVSINYKVF